MTIQHRCPECGWVHFSGQRQYDRALSAGLVGLLLGLALTLLGCAQRVHDARPDAHPGGNAVERMTYCARVHEGAHLPEDQDRAERW